MEWFGRKILFRQDSWPEWLDGDIFFRQLTGEDCGRDLSGEKLEEGSDISILVEMLQKSGLKLKKLNFFFKDGCHTPMQ